MTLAQTKRSLHPHEDGPRFANQRIARQIDSLANMATFEDVRAVWGLLHRQPAFLGLVFDALRLIGETLDYDDVVISVGRATAAESDTRTCLDVRVVTSLGVAEALEQLGHFDDQWLVQPFEVRQKLCVDIDFR